MKHRAWLILLVMLFNVESINAACKDRANLTSDGPVDNNVCQNTSQITFVKRAVWDLFWLDGWRDLNAIVQDSGTNRWWGSISCPPSFTCCEACWPAFHTAFWDDDGDTATFIQDTHKGIVSNGACTTESTGWRHQYSHTCEWGAGPEGPCDPPGGCDPYEMQECYELWNWRWDEPTCNCVCEPAYGCFTPVLVDINGNSFELTDASGGINFDFNNDGVKEKFSWTVADSDDAWLVLDRNGNGLIDNGSELFGNATAQSEPPAGIIKNGFNALAEFDKPTTGGNQDGVISASDNIFSSLRLWQDTNHNGVSEPSELKTLSHHKLVTLDLEYKESKKSDLHGNQFRYRAKAGDAHGSQFGRWAWDVFLVSP